MPLYPVMELLHEFCEQGGQWRWTLRALLCVCDRQLCLGASTPSNVLDRSDLVAGGDEVTKKKKKKKKSSVLGGNIRIVDETVTGFDVARKPESLKRLQADDDEEEGVASPFFRRGPLFHLECSPLIPSFHDLSSLFGSSCAPSSFTGALRPYLRRGHYLVREVPLTSAVSFCFVKQPLVFFKLKLHVEETLVMSFTLHVTDSWSGLCRCASAGRSGRKASCRATGTCP